MAYMIIYSCCKLPSELQNCQLQHWGQELGMDGEHGRQGVGGKIGSAVAGALD